MLITLELASQWVPVTPYLPCDLQMQIAGDRSSLHRSLQSCLFAILAAMDAVRADRLPQFKVSITSSSKHKKQIILLTSVAQMPVYLRCTSQLDIDHDPSCAALPKVMRSTWRPVLHMKTANALCSSEPGYGSELQSKVHI